MNSYSLQLQNIVASLVANHLPDVHSIRYTKAYETIRDEFFNSTAPLTVDNDDRNVIHQYYFDAGIKAVFHALEAACTAHDPNEELHAEELDEYNSLETQQLD